MNICWEISTICKRVTIILIMSNIVHYLCIFDILAMFMFLIMQPESPFLKDVCEVCLEKLPNYKSKASSNSIFTLMRRSSFVLLEAV